MNTFHLHRLTTSGSKGPVVFIPGVGTGYGYFMPPTQVGLPQILLDMGYDVWLLDWRPVGGSPWTVEDVAAMDIPVAIETVANKTQRPVRIIAHCIGSIATMMAAVAGLLPSVELIITNAVSLHPVIPWASYLRMRTLLPLSGLFPTFLDPQWGLGTGTGVWPSLFRIASRNLLSGCQDTTCKMIRWLYGDVWRHENISGYTHNWLVRQFHEVPVSFFQHASACIRRGEVVADRVIFTNLMERKPQTDARFVFLAGRENKCFLPISQIRTYGWMMCNGTRKDHTAHVLPDYGHLDMFVGQRAERDVFPLIVKELTS